MTILQQLGIGMALAIAVDATIVHGVLLPAFMRLAGPANWWAPAPLPRLHARLGVAEDAGADGAGTDGLLPVAASHLGYRENRSPFR